MNSNGALERILKSFERYYDIKTEDVESPFAAEAVFKSHNEQYFLVKAAKLADIDSNEFVFFYSPHNSEADDSELSSGQASELAKMAWERGLSRVTPYFGHRNSDVTLIYLSEKIPDESFKTIKKLNFYKSYKFSLYGWCSFRALAYETSTGRFATNRRGSDLKKIVSSLI